LTAAEAVEFLQDFGNVDRKNIAELAGELQELVQRTRDGEISREEMQGGTFTITNVGIVGGTSFVPIVNFPQVAIGDVTGEPLLAFEAMHKGKIAAEVIAGEPAAFDVRCIPAVVDTESETESEAAEAFLGMATHIISSKR
jgi:pyruvate/2-oxoglutarate dehydrogenase complex dihydrolipoamide acyltransferase (E2) component